MEPTVTCSGVCPIAKCVSFLSFNFLAISPSRTPSSPTLRLTPNASRITTKANTKETANAVEAPSTKNFFVSYDTTKAECDDGIPPVTIKSFNANFLCLNKYTTNFTNCAPNPANNTANNTLFITKECFQSLNRLPFTFIAIQILDNFINLKNFSLTCVTNIVSLLT